MNFLRLEDGQFDETGGNVAKTNSFDLTPEVISCLGRLEAIYLKLWCGLRAAVKLGFATHGDVLEAGTYVQVLMKYARRILHSNKIKIISFVFCTQCSNPLIHS